MKTNQPKTYLCIRFHITHISIFQANRKLGKLMCFFPTFPSKFIYMVPLSLSFFLSLSLSPSRPLAFVLTFLTQRGTNHISMWIFFYYTIIVIDREVLSVNIVIEPVSMGLFFFCCCFHLCNQSTLQQNLAIALSSNFLSLFSNTRRRSDSTNRWPLKMALTYDLDLSVLLYFEP